MTTFQYPGCLLLWVTAIVATPTFGGSAARADSVESAAGAAQREKPDCSEFQKPAIQNRYVLLLFFDKDPKYLPGIQTALGIQDTHHSGCIPDPDAAGVTKGAVGAAHGIVVEGSCPTDCGGANKAEAGHRAPASRSKATTGDPLRRQKNGKPKWTLFFADSKGNTGTVADNAEDDGRTTFRVWQIMAKDACHAGRLLSLLYAQNDKVFSPVGGYLGEIMIGYTPPLHATKRRSTQDCVPWDPKTQDASP